MSSRPPSKIVFVGNIPYGLSEEQISDIFSSAGRVVSFRLVYDRENGKPKGFGFAEYPDSDSAASAVRNLNDYEVMGRKLRVDFSNEGGEDGHAGLTSDYIPSLSSMVPMSSTGGGGGSSATSSSAAAAAAAAAAAGASASSISLPPSSSSSSLLPPLPPGRDIPPGASATDEISRILRTLPPTQLLDILAQMKTLATGDPARATELLAQAPQLAYAVFQALLLMDLVSPEAIQSVVEVGGGGGGVAAAGLGGLGGLGLGPAQGGPAVAAGGYAPAAAYPYGAAADVAAPMMAPAAAPAAVPLTAAAAPAAVPQNPDELIKQVLELPQAVIDQLPEVERTQLMALRMQYGGGAR